MWVVRAVVGALWAHRLGPVLVSLSLPAGPVDSTTDAGSVGATRTTVLD